jgi:hypothetical protein
MWARPTLAPEVKSLDAFSKKLSRLKAAIVLHFAYCNFCRIRSSLRVKAAMETS